MTGWLLGRLGQWVRPWSIKSPFTNVYGLARTLLALASAATLALNPSSVLFTPVSGVFEIPKCTTGLLKISLFCLAHTRLGVARWVGVLLLLIIASGWRPRFTAIPHAWIAYSIFSSITIFDGGDQINLVLTVLLLPIALLDHRRWHWSKDYSPGSSSPVKLIAWSAILMIRIQVAAVYFVSGISKLGQAEWANGTAMYYWLLTFGGTPRWIVLFLSKPIFLVLMTWGAIVLEVSLALGLVLPRKKWRVLLVIGLVFHVLIALVFDLGSFALAMMAALILFLRPADEPFALPTIAKPQPAS
jgi:antimicrobial peptide system SdpB family protein